MRKLPNLEKNDLVQKFGFAACERTLYNGRVIQQHWHNYYELEIITSGKIKHTLDKETSCIGRGDIYFLTPINSHSIISLEETGLINISFSDDMISPKLRHYLNSPIQRSFSLDSKSFAYLESRAKRLTKHTVPNIFNKEIAAAIITEILYIILQGLDLSNISESSPSIMQSAFNIIYNGYLDGITLSAVAKELNVTPQYLGRLFKSQTNTSFKDYITNLKLKRACHLLIHSGITIKEVAFESGFKSVEYFLCVFKKNINTTPSEYRRTNKQ